MDGEGPRGRHRRVLDGGHLSALLRAGRDWAGDVHLLFPPHRARGCNRHCLAGRATAVGGSLGLPDSVPVWLRQLVPLPGAAMIRVMPLPNPYKLTWRGWDLRAWAAAHADL